MFTARSYYSVFLLIALFLFPGIFSTKAFSYFHASRIPEKSKTNRVDYLTITDQMKIHEKYNQNHLARKNEVSVKWISRHPIVLDACFRYTNELSTLPPSRPQVSITGSTVNDHLTPSLSSVKFDKHKHHYYFSARLNLNKNGQIKLSNINTGQWALDSDCSGIHTNDDRRLSSETLVVLSSAAPSEPAQDETKWPAPFPITSADQSQTDDGSYSTGGGYYDDSDNDFKKRPGDGFRSLPFFEYASKLGINLVPVATSHGNTLKLRQQYTLQMNVVLTLFQNGNTQEVIISPELWNKIKLFGRYLDPQLVLYLTNNPFDPEQAYQDYLKALSKQSFPYPEGYIHWLLATLPDLIPVKASILPVNTPTPVSHPGGETTEGNSNGGGLTASGGQGAEGGYGNYGQWPSGSSGWNNNGGDGGDDGNEKRNVCQSCSKVISRPTHSMLLCRACYVNFQKSLASQVETQPNIETQKSRIFPRLFLSNSDRNVWLYQWLLDLPESEIASRLHTLQDYRQEILYQELSHQLQSNNNYDLLNRLAKKMAKVASGSGNMRDLLIAAGDLVEDNDLNRDNVVSNLLLTIAQYPSQLLKKTSISDAGSSTLKDELYSLGFTSKDFEEAKLHPVTDDVQDYMRLEIYEFFKELAYSMETTQIPVTDHFLRHLDDLFERLFVAFSFGIPMFGSTQMGLWGVNGRQMFTRNSNPYDLSRLQQVDLSALPLYLRSHPYDPQGMSTLYLAGVVIGYELDMLDEKKLSIPLRPALQNFLSEVQKNLHSVLAESSQTSKQLTHYMLTVFGFNLNHFLNHHIPRGFDPSTISRQIPEPTNPTLDSHIEDRELLWQIGEKLLPRNISAMMFIKSARIPPVIAEEITNSSYPHSRLFQQLENQEDFTYKYLIDLLRNIQRKDLISMITNKYPNMKK